MDIDDVQVGLEENREKLRLVGDEDDFVIDNEGSVNQNQPKKLKTHDILTNKSKIKPLESVRNHNKIQGVDKSKVYKLMKLPGKVIPWKKIQRLKYCKSFPLTVTLVPKLYQRRF